MDVQACFFFFVVAKLTIVSLFIRMCKMPNVSYTFGNKRLMGHDSINAMDKKNCKIDF